MKQSATGNFAPKFAYQRCEGDFIWTQTQHGTIFLVKSVNICPSFGGEFLEHEPSVCVEGIPWTWDFIKGGDRPAVYWKECPEGANNQKRSKHLKNRMKRLYEVAEPKKSSEIGLWIIYLYTQGGLRGSPKRKEPAIKDSSRRTRWLFQAQNKKSKFSTSTIPQLTGW